MECSNTHASFLQHSTRNYPKLTSNIRPKSIQQNDQKSIQTSSGLLRRGLDVASPRQEVVAPLHTTDTALSLSITSARFEETRLLLRYGAWEREPAKKQVELLKKAGWVDGDNIQHRMWWWQRANDLKHRIKQHTNILALVLTKY